MVIAALLEAGFVPLLAAKTFATRSRFAPGFAIQLGEQPTAAELPETRLAPELNTYPVTLPIAASRVSDTPQQGVRRHLPALSATNRRTGEFLTACRHQPAYRAVNPRLQLTQLMPYYRMAIHHIHLVQFIDCT
ncbi:hypothetical protein [Mycobacterium sp. HM-7]